MRVITNLDTHGSVLPPFPRVHGFYVLSRDGSAWTRTDGLTYRTWRNTIWVTP